MPRLATVVGGKDCFRALRRLGPGAICAPDGTGSAGLLAVEGGIVCSGCRSVWSVPGDGPMQLQFLRLCRLCFQLVNG